MPQDEIVIHLARAMEVRLTEAEAAHLKRTPAANPEAEDLALQCEATVEKGGYFGKGADAGYPLCAEALRADPNNVRALTTLANKFNLPIILGTSADPKADLKRADELVSQALALRSTSAISASFGGSSPRLASLTTPAAQSTTIRRVGGHREGCRARLGSPPLSPVTRSWLTGQSLSSMSSGIPMATPNCLGLRHST
jgi:hypothetical protein